MDHLAFAQLLGNYGEFVGAIAVVITLVYLAVQVSYSRAATEISNRLARAEAFRVSGSNLISLNAAFGTDPAFREAIARVLYEDVTRSDLSVNEWGVLDPYIVSVLDIYEQLFREVREGILSESVLEDFTGRWIFDLRYFRTSWHPLYKGVMSPSLIEPFEERFKLSDTAA